MTFLGAWKLAEESGKWQKEVQKIPWETSKRGARGEKNAVWKKDFFIIIL